MWVHFRFVRDIDIKHLFIRLLTDLVCKVYVVFILYIYLCLYHLATFFVNKLYKDSCCLKEGRFLVLSSLVY